MSTAVAQAVAAAIVPAMIQFSSPSGSGYNDTWVVKLEGGLVYHTAELETNLKHKDTIESITLDIGGTPIVTATGELLDLRDSLYKNAKREGRLNLELSKFRNRSPVGIYKTALATATNDDITLKVKVGSRNTDGGDASMHDPAVATLQVKGYVSENPMANTPGGGRQYLPVDMELTQYAAAAGTHKWVFPNGNQNLWLQTMIFDESVTQIERVIIKRGRKPLREMTRDDIEYGQERYGNDGRGIAPQNGFLLLDFSLFGFGSNDALNTAGLNFEFVVNGAGAIKTYVDGFEKIA